MRAMIGEVGRLVSNRVWEDGGRWCQQTPGRSKGRKKNDAPKARTEKIKDIDMAKVKSHAKWNGLSKKQQDTLEEWLFEGRTSFAKAWERAKKELGFTGSVSSLKRFYKRTAEERMLAGFAESGRVMASVNQAPVEAEELRDSGMKVAAQVFFRMVTEKPEELKAWLPLARLLAQCEKNDSWRAVKDGENEIRKAALRFSQIRFEYDVMGQALKAFPELQEAREAQEDAEMTVYEKNKRMNDLRRQMFGDVLPELLPENEEEAAHPEIIERRFREGQRREQEQYAREYRERMREQAEAKARKEGRKFTEANEGDEEETEGTEEGMEAESTGRQPEGTFTEANGGNGEKEDMAEEPQPVEEVQLEVKSAFVDEPRKLSAEERQREYEELMRRARGLL
jgi:hypothetical protein